MPRPTPPDPERRRRGRVASSHRIATAAFRLGAGFALVSLVWAGVVLLDGGSWWGPLHAFLAGAVLLAISGATQLFTVTWAAAVPPAAPTAAAQRWAVAVGVALVLVGVPVGNVPLVVLGAASAAGGVLVLALSLLGAIRRSLLNRFDLSARFYLLAAASSLVGISLGAALAAGATGPRSVLVRDVHVHLNLVGLIGFTIVGTLPTILPTFAHHPAVSGREAVAGWRLSVASAVCFLGGLLAPSWTRLGSGLAAVALLLVLGGVVVRLGRRGLQGGLAYLLVTTGSLWLAGWGLADAAGLAGSASDRAFGVWTGVAVLGVAQVLVGSLTYLVPVLIGPGPRLGRNLRTMGTRASLVVPLANLAPAALLLGGEEAAAVATGVWGADFARRLLRLEWREVGDPATEV